MLNILLALELPVSGGTLDRVRHKGFRFSLIGLVSLLLLDRGTLSDLPWIALRPPPLAAADDDDPATSAPPATPLLACR